MAEFGKRQRVQSAPANTLSTIPPPDLAGAAAILARGKLPPWAKTGPVRLVIGMLIVATTFWFLILPYAGDLLRDHRLAGTWQPAYDLQVFDAKCRRFNFVVTFCDAKVRSRPDPTKVPRSVAFVMAFTSGRGVPLVPMRSTLDPSAVAIGYAAETELMNRTLTFLAIAGFFVALFLAGVTRLLRGRYVGGRAHEALLAGVQELTARAEHARAVRRAII